MTIPTYLPFHVLIGAIATITAIVFGLHTALAKAGWSEHDRTVAVRLSAAILVGWFLLALALALGGFYRVAPDGIPTIQYGLFIPILIGAWLIWRSPVVGQIFCRNYDTTATPRDAKGVSRCLRRAGRRIWLKRKLIGFNGGRTRTRTLDPDCEFPGHRPLPAPLVTQRVWMAMRRSAEIAGYSFMGSKVGLCPSSRSDVSFE
jgi:hypothetical protein